MTKSRLFRASALSALAALLAGCVAVGPAPVRTSAPITPQPMQQGIEGEWAGSDGVTTSRFFGGRFETVANDTGNRLSDGTYVSRGGNMYQMTGTSLIRGSAISFNCLLVSSSQLNCTAAAGTQFSLMRRA